MGRNLKDEWLVIIKYILFYFVNWKLREIIHQNLTYRHLLQTSHLASTATSAFTLTSQSVKLSNFQAVLLRACNPKKGACSRCRRRHRAKTCRQGEEKCQERRRNTRREVPSSWLPRSDSADREAESVENDFIAAICDKYELPC